MGAGAEADDVVQDAFVKAYATLDRFRPDATFRPWLLRIVINETHNLRRSRQRRADREWRWSDPERGSAEDPERVVVSQERRAELVAAIERLPEQLRRVVVCRYLMELSETETAVALGVRPGTVKSRLHRSLTRLRKEVHDDD